MLPRHLEALAVRGEVAHHLVVLDLGDHGADRHADLDVLALLAVHLPTHAVFAALGAELALVAEVDQGVEVLVGHQPHRAAITAIAAIRPAQRDELLAPKAGTAIAAIAGGHADFCFVDEFHWGEP
jgi:hypothetical protein